MYLSTIACLSPAPFPVPRPSKVWWREENSYLSRFSLTQKMQGLVRPLIYVVIGYGIGGPQLLGLSHKEIKVRPADWVDLRTVGGGVWRGPVVCRGKGCVLCLVSFVHCGALCGVSFHCLYAGVSLFRQGGRRMHAVGDMGCTVCFLFCF